MTPTNQEQGESVEVTNSITYEVVHGWPKLPKDCLLGQVTGVGVDSHDRVFVFHRAEGIDLSGTGTMVSNPTILCIDGLTGEILSTWGENLFTIPHGLTIDCEDNIWVTDVGEERVLKFSDAGDLLLVVGEKGVPGLDGQHFNRPTDIAVTPAGEFYVSDGYGNSRVAKFAADGTFLFDWGEKGAGPGQFQTPHSITLDAEGKVYVADRENARIQIFDPDGHFIAQWKSAELGRPWGVQIGPDNLLYVADGGDWEPEGKPSSHVLKLDLDGNILAKWGSHGRYDGQFVWAHEVAVGSDGSVYVGDLLGMRIQKFERRLRST